MKLKEIERLRGVAILMVLTVHFDSVQRLVPVFAAYPWSGVDLFFVISGYVVSLSLMRMLPPLEGAASSLDALSQAGTSLREFYVRRLFRIVPSALAVMLACRGLVAALPIAFGTTAAWSQEAAAFFGGVYNYVYPYHHEFRFDVYWSLSVEEHFYLVLPALFVLFRTRDRRLAACLVVALASIASRLLPVPAGADPEFYRHYTSHGRFDSLMVGVALALLSRRAPGSSGTPSAPVLPAAFTRWVLVPVALAVVWCLPTTLPLKLARDEELELLAGFSGLLVFYASLDRGYVLSFPVVGRALEYVGSRSYALYLTHVAVLRLDEAERPYWPVLSALFPREERFPWRRALFLLAAAFLVAEVLHRAVERPFMALGRRLVDRETPPLQLSRRARVTLVAAALALLVVGFRHRLMLALGPPDLALGAHVTATSHLEGKPDPSALTNGVLEGELGLHTAEEDGPYATIDLGHVTDIGALRVYNRDDGHQERDLPLQAFLSNDDVHYVDIGRRETVFTQDFPWRIECVDCRARYVRLRVDAPHTSLCLSEVEIFDDPVMAAIP